VSLAPEDFEVLRQLIRDKSGLVLGDGKATFLDVRLQPRLQARNIRTAREYYHFLRFDPAGAQELRALFDAITVGETWFFRETEAITAWRDTVAARRVAAGLRTRVWSAACSTGEEPYTVAMLLLARFADAAARFEVVATDLSDAAVARARLGVYDEHALRRTPPLERDSWFGMAPGARGLLAVADGPRDMVRFAPGNLLDPALPGPVGSIDLVLCRNVLIYFDDETRRRALDTLYVALRPGGHLILAQCETLAHVASPFETVRLGDQVVYHKPEPAFSGGA
jgi:chemotaxis protein methyltransferase CheR